MAPFAARGLCNFIHKNLAEFMTLAVYFLRVRAEAVRSPSKTGLRPDNVISNQPKSANDYHRTSPLYVTELQMKVTLARPLAPGHHPTTATAERRIRLDSRLFVNEETCSVSKACWI